MLNETISWSCRIFISLFFHTHIYIYFFLRIRDPWSWKSNLFNWKDCVGYYRHVGNFRSANTYFFLCTTLLHLRDMIYLQRIQRLYAMHQGNKIPLCRKNKIFTCLWMSKLGRNIKKDRTVFQHNVLFPLDKRIVNVRLMLSELFSSLILQLIPNNGRRDNIPFHVLNMNKTREFMFSQLSRGIEGNRKANKNICKFYFMKFKTENVSLIFQFLNSFRMISLIFLFSNLFLSIILRILFHHIIDKIQIHLIYLWSEIQGNGNEIASIEST